MANNKVDKASYRNNGGIIQTLISKYKLKRYFSKYGSGVVVKRSSEFRLTDGAYLEIGDNCVIQDYCFFQLTKPRPRVVIGNGVVIGRHNMITAKANITIGDNTIIGAYVQITDQDHGIRADRIIKDQEAIIKDVSIGSGCWIGAGAKILRGVNIGRGVVIGSNSVVTRDIPDMAIAVGVPAKVIKYRK